MGNFDLIVCQIVVVLLLFNGLKAIVVGQYWPWQWQHKISADAIEAEKNRRKTLPPVPRGTRITKF